MVKSFDRILLCGCYADVVYRLMRNLFATFFISEFVQLVPWLVKITLGESNRQMNHFTKAFAISAEEIPSSGILSEYFVNKSWIVNIYSFPLLVLGNRLTMSMLTLSKALPCVSVRTSSLFWSTSPTGILCTFLRILESSSSCCPNSYADVFSGRFSFLICVLQ